MINSKIARSIGLSIIFIMLGITNAGAAPNAKQIEFWDDHEPTSRLNLDHGKWNSLLEKYVKTDHPSGINRFDYASVSAADKSLLDGYLSYLQQMDPRQLTRAGQKAYWLNLYNAGIVALVLGGNVEDSIRDLGRIWKRKRFYIAMQNTSLDDIQHGIVRPMFDDPRTLLAINAATLGSTSIQPVAFDHENVEELLDKITRSFLAQRHGLSIDGNTLVLSRIFRWYVRDFGGREGLMRFLKTYSSPEIAASLEKLGNTRYVYDWALNKP